MKQAILRPKEERRLLRGHLWAYRNEFDTLPELEDGEAVDVLAAKGRFVGRGFFQERGGIAVRLLTRRKEPVDRAFLQARLDQAREYRERLFPDSRAYRWIHGESDGLPGLVVDRYGATVCVRSACAYYRHVWEDLSALLLAAPGVEGGRVEFGNQRDTFGVEPGSVTFPLEGLSITLELEDAQKTGMYLDQRLNRAALAPFAQGARVLDGHCHVGLWSCMAAQAGAREVLGVDTSETALAQARHNAEANGVASACTFEQAEIEDVLERGERHGAVILDPPAFAKARGHTAKALNRYKELNTAAMAAVEPGGLLVSCSCSHFVDTPAFLEMLKRAAVSAHRQAWLIEMRGAAPDHPVMLAMPETAYLKCAFLRVW